MIRVELAEGIKILGLGDVIIPGLLCSFCYRIDFIRQFRAKEAAEPTLYRGALVTYCTGLLAAFLTCHFSG